MARKKRSGANRFDGAQSSKPPEDEAAWTDLEQAFFASAPPDNPDPPAEAESFDDLV